MYRIAYRLFSQHNLNYWEFGDYLGLGAGAHGKITDHSRQQIIRYHLLKNPKDYLNSNNSRLKKQIVVSKSELALEFMMNALRLEKPISIDLFKARTGLTVADIQTTLDVCAEKDFLFIRNHQFHVTKHGRRFLNELLELFLPLPS